MEASVQNWGPRRRDASLEPSTLVGGQHRAAQGLEDPGGDPLIAPPAQRRRRARGIAEFVEDDAVVEAPLVTTQRMAVEPGRRQGEELLAQPGRTSWAARTDCRSAGGSLAQ